MTWGVVSSCRQDTWPFNCDYPNFSASNVECPRTAELGTVSCKWNYSVNHGRAQRLCWWKHTIARLCLSSICSLNLPTVRHRDECYVMAFPCGSSSHPFPRHYLITSQANTPGLSLKRRAKGILILLNCICEHWRVNLSFRLDWIHTSIRGIVSLRDFAEHPNWPLYMCQGCWDR